jgi:hypothetical protein
MFGRVLQAQALASYWLKDFTEGTPTVGKTYKYNAMHSLLVRHLKRANSHYHCSEISIG